MKIINLLLLFLSPYTVFAQSFPPSIDWQICLGGSGEDYGYSVQQTNDGGYIVAGSAGSNNGLVIGNHGGSDYWIVKLNNYGAIEWKKCLGGTSSEIAYSIICTSDGGYIVAGESYSNDWDVTLSNGGGDYWIVKLDSIGSIMWQRSIGGTGSEDARSIIENSDGGYVVAGSTVSSPKIRPIKSREI